MQPSRSNHPPLTSNPQHTRQRRSGDHKAEKSTTITEPAPSRPGTKPTSLNPHIIHTDFLTTTTVPGVRRAVDPFAQHKSQQPLLPPAPLPRTSLATSSSTKPPPPSTRPAPQSHHTLSQHPTLSQHHSYRPHTQEPDVPTPAPFNIAGVPGFSLSPAPPQPQVPLQHKPAQLPTVMNTPGHPFPISYPDDDTDPNWGREYHPTFVVHFNGQPKVLGEGAYSRVYLAMVNEGNEFTRAAGLSRGDFVSLKRIPHGKATEAMRKHEIRTLRKLVENHDVGGDDSDEDDAEETNEVDIITNQSIKRQTPHIPKHSSKSTQSNVPPHQKYIYDNPHVSHYLGHIDTTRTLTIIMTFCPHDSFKLYFSHMLCADIQYYMRGLLLAVAYIHSRGIIHRDIKPGNFLHLVGTNNYTLVDYGLAQFEGAILKGFFDRFKRKAGESSQEKVQNKINSTIDGNGAGTHPKGNSEQQSTSSGKQFTFYIPESVDTMKELNGLDRNALSFLDHLYQDGIFNEDATTYAKQLQFTNKHGYAEFSQYLSRCKLEKMEQLKNIPLSQQNNHTDFSQDDPLIKVDVKLNGKRLENVDRAGTKGFRAPEILAKHPLPQTNKIDIWSCGVILLSILSRRYPFFTSNDDYFALVEIMRVLGLKEYVLDDITHVSLDAHFPVSKSLFHTIYALCGIKWPPTLLDLLGRMMDPNPQRRISALEALHHPFFFEDVRVYDAILFGRILPLHITELCITQEYRDRFLQQYYANTTNQEEFAEILALLSSEEGQALLDNQLKYELQRSYYCDNDNFLFDNIGGGWDMGSKKLWGEVLKDPNLYNTLASVGVEMDMNNLPTHEELSNFLTSNTMLNLHKNTTKLVAQEYLLAFEQQLAHYTCSASCDFDYIKNRPQDPSYSELLELIFATQDIAFQRRNELIVYISQQNAQNVDIPAIIQSTIGGLPQSPVIPNNAVAPMKNDTPEGAHDLIQQIKRRAQDRDIRFDVLDSEPLLGSGVDSEFYFDSCADSVSDHLFLGHDDNHDLHNINKSKTDEDDENLSFSTLYDHEQYVYFYKAQQLVNGENVRVDCDISTSIAPQPHDAIKNDLYYNHLLNINGGVDDYGWKVQQSSHQQPQQQCQELPSSPTSLQFNLSTASNLPSLAPSTSQLISDPSHRLSDENTLVQLSPILCPPTPPEPDAQSTSLTSLLPSEPTILINQTTNTHHIAPPPPHPSPSLPLSYHNHSHLPAQLSLFCLTRPLLPMRYLPSVTSQFVLNTLRITHFDLINRIFLGTSAHDPISTRKARATPAALLTDTQRRFNSDMEGFFSTLGEQIRQYLTKVLRKQHSTYARWAGLVREAQQNDLQWHLMEGSTTYRFYPPKQSKDVHTQTNTGNNPALAPIPNAQMEMALLYTLYRSVMRWLKTQHEVGFQSSMQYMHVLIKTFAKKATMLKSNEFNLKKLEYASQLAHTNRSDYAQKYIKYGRIPSINEKMDGIKSKDDLSPSSSKDMFDFTVGESPQPSTSTLEQTSTIPLTTTTSPTLFDTDKKNSDVQMIISQNHTNTDTNSSPAENDFNSLHTIGIFSNINVLKSPTITTDVVTPNSTIIPKLLPTNNNFASQLHSINLIPPDLTPTIPVLPIVPPPQIPCSSLLPRTSCLPLRLTPLSSAAVPAPLTTDALGFLHNTHLIPPSHESHDHNYIINTEFLVNDNVQFNPQNGEILPNCVVSDQIMNDGETYVVNNVHKTPRESGVVMNMLNSSEMSTPFHLTSQSYGDIAGDRTDNEPEEPHKLSDWSKQSDFAQNTLDFEKINKKLKIVQKFDKKSLIVDDITKSCRILADDSLSSSSKPFDSHSSISITQFTPHIEDSSLQEGLREAHTQKLLTQFTTQPIGSPADDSIHQNELMDNNCRNPSAHSYGYRESPSQLSNYNPTAVTNDENDRELGESVQEMVKSIDLSIALPPLSVETPLPARSTRSRHKKDLTDHHKSFNPSITTGRSTRSARKQEEFELQQAIQNSLLADTPAASTRSKKIVANFVDNVVKNVQDDEIIGAMTLRSKKSETMRSKKSDKPIRNINDINDLSTTMTATTAHSTTTTVLREQEFQAVVDCMLGSSDDDHSDDHYLSGVYYGKERQHLTPTIPELPNARYNEPVGATSDIQSDNNTSTSQQNFQRTQTTQRSSWNQPPSTTRQNTKDTKEKRNAADIEFDSAMNQFPVDNVLTINNSNNDDGEIADKMTNSPRISRRIRKSVETNTTSENTVNTRKLIESSVKTRKSVESPINKRLGNVNNEKEPIDHALVEKTPRKRGGRLSTQKDAQVDSPHNIASITPTSDHKPRAKMLVTAVAVRKSTRLRTQTPIYRDDDSDEDLDYDQGFESKFSYHNSAERKNNNDNTTDNETDNINNHKSLDIITPIKKRTRKAREQSAQKPAEKSPERLAIIENLVEEPQRLLFGDDDLEEDGENTLLGSIKKKPRVYAKKGAKPATPIETKPTKQDVTETVTLRRSSRHR